MSFEFRDAVRVNAPLLIGLAGGTGSGKTESAMKIATGLAGGKKFAVIDTEAGRALHKADDYSFDHGDLVGPFTPERYWEAVKVADDAGYPVIVIDSGSHLWEGVGGILEMQEEELERLMQGNESRRQALTAKSWIKPKQRHRKFVNQLLQIRAHVIFCMRAQDKIEIVREGGKTVIRPMESLTGASGWIPICERRFPHELTLSLLLTADAPGVPKVIKLEGRHRPMVPLDRQLGEETGAALAAWAHGSGAASAEGTPVQEGRSTAASSVEEASRPADDAPAPSFPPNVMPSTEGVRFATEAQRKRLFAIKKEHGVEDARLREILGEITGQESTAQIPSALYDKVIAAIDAEPVAEAATA